MIHDLDVVLAFVKSQVTSVDAVGIPVLSSSEDIANARLRFANGCIANMTVSRVSPERMRKIRVFSSGPVTSYISLDYRAQEGFIYRIAGESDQESSLWKKLLHGKDATIVSQFGGRRIVRQPVPIEKEEPLRLELKHFIDCVRAHRTPEVSGESAKRALDLAFEITRQVQRAGFNPQRGSMGADHYHVLRPSSGNQTSGETPPGRFRIVHMSWRISRIRTIWTCVGSTR